MTTTMPLYRLAKVIRSKNAKPYRYTFDVLFDDRELFEYVKEKRILTKSTIAKTFGVDESVIISSFIFDAGMAFKFTMKRPLVQGAPGDSDIYGAQQHGPLMYIEVPWNNDENLKARLKPKI